MPGKKVKQLSGIHQVTALPQKIVDTSDIASKKIEASRPQPVH